MAVLVLAAASPRASADTLRGKRLYLDTSNLAGTTVSCVDCHGGLPGGAFGIGAAANDPALVEMAVATIPQMTPFRDRLAAADFVDLASYIGDPAVPSPEVRTIDRVAFEELEIGDSEPATLEVRNAGAVAFAITAAPVMSGDAFVLESSDCTAGLVLVPSASCRVVVAFAPQTVAVHTGRVTVAHDWVRGAAAIALRGSARDRPETMEPPPSSSSGCAIGRENALWLVLALFGLRRR